MWIGQYWRMRLSNMKFLSKCELLDKEILVDGKRRQVLGLASFRTEPRGIGIGKASLRVFEQIAEIKGYLGVFCFCFDDVAEFYNKCGWHDLGMYQGKHMFSSVPLKNVEVWEIW